MSGQQPPKDDPLDPEPGDVATAQAGSTATQCLDAQASLLRYALMMFGVGLPILAWAASFAPDGLWVLGSFTIFAINWAAFYAVLDWARRRPDQAANVRVRTRVHILGGLLWAGAIAQMTAIGLGAGQASQPLLLLALAAAAICVFFSAPSLPALLIVGPAACAAPLVALFLNPDGRPLARIALAATALAFALALIVNRLLRRLFTLADERERLTHERARALAKATRLAKSKSDLIATLSHEIKTGLTGVAHVLAAAVSGDRAPSREQLSAALDSAEDLVAVLNATLDTEVAAAGELSLMRIPFDPARVVRDLVLLNRPLAAAKDLELSMHVDEALSEDGGGVIGDAVRTRQILANLVGNALKYTLRGRVEVRVERLGSDRVRVAIADTGPGLASEELSRAFEPFSRIERTCTGVPGAGLGLSLSRELALLMGGEITAESAQGVGSCFRLDLPYDPTAVPARRDAAPIDAQALPRPSQLKVLVAEEDSLGAAKLRGVLEKLGHQVLHARDGQRACDLVQVCDIDLVMVVGRMSEIDAAETARGIRSLSGAGGRIPIIAVIDGDGEEARAVLEAGADQVLRKPVSVASVARALAAVAQAKAKQSGRLAVA